MSTCSSRCQATQESFHCVETSSSLSSATRKAIDYASTIRVPSSVSEIIAAAKELSLKESMPSKKPSQPSVKPINGVGTKTIQLQEGDDSKTTIIGAGLGDK